LARAYVGLVDVQFYLIDLGLAPSVEEALAKQMEAAQKAVEIDPDDGKTHLALGTAYEYHGKPQQALAEFDRAETLSPSDADLLLVIAWSIPGFGETERAVSLAERALKLNPHYPDWYNQGLSYVFFFGEQYDKLVKYRLLVKEPLALDYAFLAMAHAYLGRTGDAEAAAANVKKLDLTWIAERYLSEGGGYADKEAKLFVDCDHGYAVDRASVRQRKTGRPVRFEITEQTRQAIDDYLLQRGGGSSPYLFPVCGPGGHRSTRQYAAF
jgi:tetratricopeptide (TPR) repeat protein